METTTESPATVRLPEPLAKRAFAMRIKALLSKADNCGATDEQHKIAGAAFLHTFKLKPTGATLRDAVTDVVARVEALGLDMAKVTNAVTVIVEAMEAKLWGNIAAIANPTNPEDVEASEPAPREEVQPRRRGEINVPELPRIVVPTNEVNPGDPLHGLYTAMEPRMKAVATAAQADVLSKLEPVIKALVEQINEANTIAAATGSTIDEGQVKRMIGAALGNGAGEEMKKIVAAHAPSMLSTVLDKAARAIESATITPPEEVKLNAPFVPVPDPYYSMSAELEAAIKLIEALNSNGNTDHTNTMLVGPAGCGKTAFAIELAARTGREIIIMDCANLRESVEWFGSREVSNGSTRFDKSQFVLAIERGNVVVLFDEFNRASDYIRNVLYPLLDMRRQTYVERCKAMVKVGPGVIFLATMNEGRDYSGTHNTDKAMKDRFRRRIELTYLAEDKEVEVVTKKTRGIKRSDAHKLVQLANTIRSKSDTFGGALSETLSTRAVLSAAKDYVVGGAVTFRNTVFSHFSAENGTSSERSQVIQMFEGKGFKLNETAPAPESVG